MKGHCKYCKKTVNVDNLQHVRVKLPDGPTLVDGRVCTTCVEDLSQFYTVDKKILMTRGTVTGYFVPEST